MTTSDPNGAGSAASGADRRHPIRHWLLLVLRVLLGGVFAYAAWGKLLAPYAFADAISSFDMVPESLLMVSAIVLIWHELVCGVFMLLGL